MFYLYYLFLKGFQMTYIGHKKTFKTLITYLKQNGINPSIPIQNLFEVTFLYG